MLIVLEIKEYLRKVFNNMQPIEIIVIVLTALFLLALIARYIYKKVHHLPTGECASCASKGGGLVKMYRKKYKGNK
jgi:hypothetical protein